MELVRFENSKKSQLAGALFLPNRYHDGIILCHGWRGSMFSSHKMDWATLLKDTGYGVMCFDFSGHGDSEGSEKDITLQQQISDLRAAIKFFKPNLPHGKLHLVGHSRGGFVVGMVALDEPVATVTFAATPLKGTPSAPYYNVKTSCSAMLRQLKMPKCFIHGTADPMVSYEHSQQAYDELLEPKEIHLIKGANHAFDGHVKEFGRALVEFLRK